MAKKSKKKNTKKKGTKLGKLKTIKQKEKSGKIKNFNPKKNPKKNTEKNILPTAKEANIALASFGRIGNFGKTIIFIVSEEQLLTFTNMTREIGSRWTTHPAIKKREKTEFLGPDLAKISMDITLDYSLGVNPRNMISKIEKIVNSGIAENLIIGGKKIGANKYRITNISENWDTIVHGGVLYRATVALTFEEYVE